jgi:SAM-dependent methyltransferase
MHRSELNQTLVSIQTYLEPGRRLHVLDLGWGHKRAHVRAHRELLAGYDVKYRRLDVLNTPKGGGARGRRYGIPARSNAFDVVLSSQTLPHVPFFWATLLEIERVLAPGGFALLSGASRGHPNQSQDCWRFYADAYRAMAAHTGLTLLDAHIDLPRWDQETGRCDYAAVRTSRYWGDCVGVLQKPQLQRDRLRRAVVRTAARWWANQVGGLEGVPVPPALPERTRDIQKVVVDGRDAGGKQAVPGNGTSLGAITA